MYHGDFPVENDDLTLSKTTAELLNDERNKSRIINDYFTEAFRSIVLPEIPDQGVDQKIWYTFLPKICDFGQEITIDKWKEARAKPYFDLNDLPYVAPLVHAEYKYKWIPQSDAAHKRIQAFEFIGFHHITITPKSLRQGIRMIVFLLDKPQATSNQKQSDVVTLMDVTFGPPSWIPFTDHS